MDLRTNRVATVVGDGQNRDLDSASDPLAASIKWPFSVAWDPLTPIPETRMFIGGADVLRCWDKTTGQVWRVPPGGVTRHITFAPSGHLLLAHRVVYGTDPVSQQSSSIAGYGDSEGEFASTDGDFRTARFGGIWGLALSRVDHCLYVSDHYYHCLRRIEISPELFVPSTETRAIPPPTPAVPISGNGSSK